MNVNTLLKHLNRNLSNHLFWPTLSLMVQDSSFKLTLLLLVWRILSQIQDGAEKVIAYGGRSLSKSEMNYSITELEALAVVVGVKKYSSFLLHGSKFQIVTDHSALCWLFNQKPTTGRIARCALCLQSYDFEIVHRPGKANANVDTRSRMHDNAAVQSKLMSQNQLNVPDKK